VTHSAWRGLTDPSTMNGADFAVGQSRMLYGLAMHRLAHPGAALIVGL